MLRKLLCTMLFLAAPLAMAQAQSPAEPERFGDLLVYRTVFNSSYLPPETAANVGLERGPTHGVINIAVQRQTPEGPEPIDAIVEGNVRNVLEQRQDLDFIRVQEEEAIYFVANYTAAQRGVLRFEVSVQAEEGAPEHTMTFMQEFYPDE
ncbi:DUF4426 domain-containing protein [Pseudomonas sp. OIL-1]|uniref:DUF4426 domain-containing protein n=1 Tax=Pseudomonas sp. OIL-1 TaxID=2706126 RepID=UPI0013A72203|nr:DUF4426 domain-containing protein [Pseudomonas sp. OIL-1]QIB50585.1 DUF4426 domain-containing protein [Pseudomonas sp. OIL-1]